MAQLAASAQRLVRHAMLLSWEAAASLSEVLITADGLAGSAADVMGILVHEAAHAIACQRGIKDTSRQGRYHNSRFKAIAEEVGLDVSRDPPTATRSLSSHVRSAPPVSTSCIRFHSIAAPAAPVLVCCVSAVRGIGPGAPCPPSAAPSAAYVAAVS